MKAPEIANPNTPKVVVRFRVWSEARCGTLVEDYRGFDLLDRTSFDTVRGAKKHQLVLSFPLCCEDDDARLATQDWSKDRTQF
jgi:hypothetical protein